MLESCSALMDIDHILSAIEQRIQITPEEMIVSPEIQVCWYAVEPGDIFLLLASLSGLLKGNYIPEVFSRSVLTLPMVVRYADQVRLVIEFTPGSNLDFFHAYDSVHLDQLTLDTGSASGRLVLGKDLEQHHTIDETATLINFITELFTTIENDAASSITSITFEAPLEHLKYTVIRVNMIEHDVRADVLWLVLPARDITKKEESALVQCLKKTGDVPVMPLLVFPWNYFKNHDIDSGRADEVQCSIESCEKFIRSFGITKSLPVLPVYLSALTGDAVEDSYEHECFARIWQSIHSLGCTDSSWRKEIERRYQSLMTICMKPPESIIGLLRQRSLLKALDSLPDFRDEHSLMEVFTSLQRKGIAVYGALAEEYVRKRKYEEWEHRETIILQVIEFLKQLKNTEYMAVFSDELSRLFENAGKQETFINKHSCCRFLASVDTIFENAAQQLKDLTRKCKEKHAEMKIRYNKELKESDEEYLKKYDQEEFFWRTFIRVSLEKIKISTPDKEILNICTIHKQNFIEYITLTPADENELKKCVTIKWPLIVRQCMDKMNSLMNDTKQIWELTLSQELAKVEEFREKNFPDRPCIPKDVMISDLKKPKLSETLIVSIKSYGLKKFFLTADEKEKWRIETVTTIKLAAEQTLESYASEVSVWFNALKREIRSIKDRVCHAAEHVFQMLQHKKNEQNKLKAEDRADMKKKLDECLSQLEHVQYYIKDMEEQRDAWARLKAIFS